MEHRILERIEQIEKTLELLAEQQLKLKQLTAPAYYLPPKKVMMQMWRTTSDGYCAAYEVDLDLRDGAERVGEPFEFVFPEGGEG